MWDITDVKDDVVEQVNIISTTMKKTMSRQAFKKKEDESTPLLMMVANNPSMSTEYETNNEVSAKIPKYQQSYVNAQIVLGTF